VKHKFAANDIALLPNASGAPPQMPIRHKAMPQRVSGISHNWVWASPDSIKIHHESKLYAPKTRDSIPSEQLSKALVRHDKTTKCVDPKTLYKILRGHKINIGIAMLIDQYATRGMTMTSQIAFKHNTWGLCAHDDTHHKAKGWYPDVLPYSNGNMPYGPMSIIVWFQLLVVSRQPTWAFGGDYRT